MLRGIDPEDIKLWVHRDNLIDQSMDENGISFTTFKRHFFPRLYQNYERDDIVGAPDQQWEDNFL